MKRISRKLSDSTKVKISKSLKGRNKSAEHKQRISEGMKKYWATIPKQQPNT